METMKPEQQPSQTPQRPRINWFWWIVLLGLMIWNAWALWPSSRPEVGLPYSAFLAQVRADNVKSVQISGSEITGKFAQPVTRPTPAPEATPSAPTRTAQPTPVPQKYTAFVTTFPESVGDANLISLLESYSVEVNVTPPPNPLLSALLANGLPLLLLVLVMMWMGRQAT